MTPTMCFLYLLGLFVPWMIQAQEGVAFCDDCFCIPGSGDSCPTMIPQTDFSQELLDNLRAITHLNPISLNCDSYVDATCNTDPPMQQGGACVAEILAQAEFALCPQEFSYR
jgi:hypothetical protein